MQKGIRSPIAWSQTPFFFMLSHCSSVKASSSASKMGIWVWNCVTQRVLQSCMVSVIWPNWASSGLSLMLNTADSKRQFPVAGFGWPGWMQNGVGKILWANLTAISCNLDTPPAPPLNLFTSCNSLFTDSGQTTVDSDLFSKVWTRSSVLSSFCLVVFLTCKKRTN